MRFLGEQVEVSVEQKAAFVWEYECRLYWYCFFIPFLISKESGARYTEDAALLAVHNFVEATK